MKTLTFTVTVLIASLFAGCAFYSFSGSTLPAHLKTVEIPLFFNKSLQPGIAEEITDEISRKVLSANLLRVVSSGGDARISGTITSYTHDPHTYGSAGNRSVDISEYAVKVRVDVEFVDQKKEQPLYEGSVTGEGIYNFGSENEEIGRRRAVANIIEQILQNSVQSW